ncbi:MAG: efflux RND transporter periplasmic adaptor subunit [Syntrophobacteraceae bacterium]
MRRAFRISALVLAGLAVMGAAGAWWLWHNRHRAPMFHTAAVKRGDLVATISATGTVEPEQVVDVGCQVNGLLIAFGKDVNGNSCDYGSVVEQNGVVALIDATLYVAAVDMDKASLEQARANLVNAKANILLMKAKLWEAEADWHRAEKLGPGQSLAPTTYDQYKANYDEAVANLAVAVAQVDMAEAAVHLAAETLKRDQATLAYCTVKSPVAGVIVDRRVNIGQTMVSSTSAPSIFLIAKDLKRIQVWASVNEADIGHIHPGQPVTFTVDAFGDQVFHAVVGKIRLNATMSQNVVTYTVEVNCDNSDGKLLPYLTTNLQFEIGRCQNVLLAPNASLRWTPRFNRTASQSGGAHTAAGHGVGGVAAGGATASHGTFWVAQGDTVRPINVHVGLTDGVWTEVSGDELTEGMPAITEEGKQELEGNQSEGTSPLIPQRGGFHGPNQAPSGGGR